MTQLWSFSILFFFKLKSWCSEAGGGIEIVYETKEPKLEGTKIDASNPYWTAFEGALKELYVLYIFFSLSIFFFTLFYCSSDRLKFSHLCFLLVQIAVMCVLLAYQPLASRPWTIRRSYCMIMMSFYRRMCIWKE